MHPDQPAAEALRTAVEEYARGLGKTVRHARRGEPEAVHDARTTIRRLREGLELMGDSVFDRARTAELARGLRRIERALGPARDDEVLLADLDGWLDNASPRARAELAPIRARLCARRRRHARRLADVLGKRRARRALRCFRRWLRGADAVPASRGEGSRPSLVRHLSAHEIWRAYDRVLAFQTRLPADVDVIHRIRSAARRLRYSLELFEEALPAGVRDLVDALRALQERLGVLHDHATAIRRIEKWLGAARVPDSRSLDIYLNGRREACARLRAEFDGEWRGSAGMRSGSPCRTSPRARAVPGASTEPSS